MKVPCLLPCDVWKGVSLCFTGDDQFSPSLLSVLPSRNHRKFWRILARVKQQDCVMKCCTGQRLCTHERFVPLAPGELERTIPWNPGHCKACRCRCQESPLSPLTHGCCHHPSVSNQGTVGGQVRVTPKNNK